MTSRTPREEWNYNSGTGGESRGRDRDAGPSNTSAQSEDCDEQCTDDPKLIAAELSHQRKELSISKSRSQPGQTTSGIGGKRLNPNKCPKPGEPRSFPSSQACHTDSDGKLVCDRGTETDSGNSGAAEGPLCRCGGPGDKPPARELNFYPLQQSAYQGPSTPASYEYLDPSTPGGFHTGPQGTTTSTPHRYPAQPCSPGRDCRDLAWGLSSVLQPDHDRTEAPNFQVQQTDESVILTIPPTHPGDNSVQVVISKQPTQHMQSGASGNWGPNSAPFDADLSGIYASPGERPPRGNVTQSSQAQSSLRAGPNESVGNRTGLENTPPWAYAGAPPEEASDLYEDYRDQSFRNRIRGPTSPGTGGNRRGQSWQQNSSDANNFFPVPDNRYESQRSGFKSPRSVPPRPPGARTGQQNMTAPSSWPYRDVPRGAQGNRNTTLPWSHAPRDDTSESFPSFRPGTPSDSSTRSNRIAPTSTRRPAPQNTTQGPWPYSPTPLDELSRMFPSDDDSTSGNQLGGTPSNTQGSPSGVSKRNG